MTLGFAPETIETWPIERLRPYAQNAKTHGPDQVARIAASIAEFGWTVPVLVGEDGEVIAGHGRILAASELGLKEAPVIVLGHLTEAQRRAYTNGPCISNEYARFTSKKRRIRVLQLQAPSPSGGGFCFCWLRRPREPIGRSRVDLCRDPLTAFALSGDWVPVI